MGNSDKYKTENIYFYYSHRCTI